MTHTTDGDVEFKAEEVKGIEDELAMIEVFTAVYKAEVLNMLHIHAHPMNEDDGIEIETVAGNEETKDYYKFKGKGLKILV